MKVLGMDMWSWAHWFMRWIHIYAAILWIGQTHLFGWLERVYHGQYPGLTEEDGKKTVWTVHGGGFYHAQKYRAAPLALPATLHWFKWEAYSTWLSGMFLLILVYWYGAGVYLIDPAVADLSPGLAVALAAAFIAGGWFVYDVLCRSPLGKHEGSFAAVLFVLVTLLAWGLCELFSGRGAYIHFGAVLGTIMVANVFFVIIPGQRRMVAATERGESPDSADGVRAKQRSVHNTYFTLPVLFAMTSNHYAMTYSHEYNWAILAAIALAGALIRIYFVARHKGRASPLPVIIATLLIVGIAVVIAPRATSAASGSVAFADVRTVVEHRCTTCHASEPTHPAFPAAPGGVVLETDAQIIAEAARIHQQTVVTRVMPIGNLTGISEDERDVIDRWYASLGEQ